MGILRLIKLKELNGDFDALSEQEKLFFKLHENLHENSNGELCNEDNEWVVHYDIENEYFWYNYDRFYLVFNEKFDINIQYINDLYTGILEEHLNCKGLTPYYIANLKERPLEEHLNCKGLTHISSFT